MPKKPELSAADQAVREAIGSAIRLASASKNCKPAEVAKAGGVSLAHQYRIESGERSPDALYLVKVARHLGISIDSLVTAIQPGQPNSNGVVQTNSGAGAVQAGRDANGATINAGTGSQTVDKSKSTAKVKGGFMNMAIGSIGRKK